MEWCCEMAAMAARVDDARGIGGDGRRWAERASACAHGGVDVPDECLRPLDALDTVCGREQGKSRRGQRCAVSVSMFLDEKVVGAQMEVRCERAVSPVPIGQGAKPYFQPAAAQRFTLTTSVSSPPPASPLRSHSPPC